MKGLLKILGGGFAAFMLLAVAQEWRFFASAWLGWEEAAPELSESQRREAAETVYLALSLMQHLYASGGDPRFADRMPVAPALVEEMRSDIDYLRSRHRVQEPSLERLDVTAVEPLGPGRMEIRTREHWWVRTLWADSGAEAEAAQLQVLERKYLLGGEDGSWRVEGWDMAEVPLPGPGS